MGIYDREYVFQQQRRRGPGGLSVTAWLMIINVAVFVIGFFTTMMGRPVFVERRAAPSNMSAAQIAEQFPANSLVVSKEFVPLSGSDLTISRKATREELHRVDPRMVGQPTLARLVFGGPKDNPVLVYVDTYTVMPSLHAWGHFSTYQGFVQLQVWRLVTFQFLHGGVLHLAFNMLGLWSFGRLVEEHLGRHRYLAFYLVTGVFGGLFYLLLNGLGALADHMGLGRVPGLLPYRTTTPLVGASAGVFGVIMAAAYLAPNMMVQLLFPPIPLKMKVLAYAFVVIAMLTVLFQGSNAGGEAAHLGGAFAGAFFIRRPHLLRDFFGEFTDLWARLRGKGPPTLTLAGQDTTGPSSPGAGSKGTLSRLDPDLNAQVDRILAKANAQGAGSLTPEEQAVLRRATDLMNRRS